MDEDGDMKNYFEDTICILDKALRSIDVKQYEKLINDCENTLNNGNTVIVSGLGKNVPVCDKFVGIMHSLGLKSGYMNTNTAVHGDIGMVQDGDLVILLSKSGTTQETIYLYNLLKKRKCHIWLLTFSSEGELAKNLSDTLVIDLEHEGDVWNIVPANSTVLNLIVLQKLCIELAKRKNVTLAQFKENHPGGHIGELLKDV